jgi:hypothetical protein
VTTKQPPIRNGQRKPYVKATRKEIEQRLKAAALLESLEWEKSDVYWFFQQVFGVETRQTDRYAAHARARYAKWLYSTG